MPVSIFHGTKSDFIQVVCLQDRYLTTLKKLGWELTPDDLPDSFPDLIDYQSEISNLKSVIVIQQEEIDGLKSSLADKAGIESGDPGPSLLDQKIAEDESKKADMANAQEALVLTEQQVKEEKHFHKKSK